ncbi:hypothetical protein [Pseudaminobacter sp. NGMCC 1.201702]|uniref:hypothetical protein n=1 Tax=Pseudaminobacter sp. NGMCC 1.201702 TaxID=3391825 RepID=UPI0039EEC273
MTGALLLAELADAAPADHRADTLVNASVLGDEETPSMRALWDARWFTSDIAGHARYLLQDGEAADDPTAESIATALRGQFGLRAVTIAAWSAFLAWNDDRQLAFRFWCEVLAYLYASPPQTDLKTFPAM